MSENDSREQGVEFGEFEGTMEEIDYPVDNDELLDQYGDEQLELPDGTATLSEVLEGAGEQTYEDEGELETMIMNMVGDEAVGRQQYSDRGDEPQEGDDEQESF